MSWLTPELSELAVNVLTIASVLSAAAFGALGLFTDYKKDGKVTRYGKIAVGGILLSAVMSISVGLLQERIAAERKRSSDEATDKQRRDNEVKFLAQIAHLTRLSSSLSGVAAATQEVQGDMAASLRAQGLLMASARRSLLVTQQASEQERANTARTLRTMWDDENRIEPANIEAIVSYNCPLRRGATPPNVLAEGSKMELILVPARLARNNSLDFKAFGEGLLLEGLYESNNEKSAKLSSISPRVSTNTSVFMLAATFRQVARFSSFDAEGAWSLAAPESWNDLLVEAIVSEQQPGSPAGLAEALNLHGPETILESYSTPYVPFWSGDKVSVFCDAMLDLRVRGRLIASSTAVIVQIVGLQGTARMVVKFPVVAVSTGDFPRYAQDPRQQ